jgi:hypothetical protein
MATAAAEARVLAREGQAVEAALVKASALGKSTGSINKLKAAHAALLAEYQKVAPAAQAFAAAEAKVASETEQAAKAAKHAAEQAKLVQALRAQEAKDHGASIKAIFKAGDEARAKVKEQAEAQAAAIAHVGENLAEMAGFAAAGAGIAIAAWTAIGSAVFSLAEKALDANEKLKLLTAQFESLGGGHSGEQILGVVDEVAKRTGQARDEVARLAKTFEGIGVRDLGQLQTELEAARASALISADGSSAAFEALSKKIQAAVDNTGHLKIAERGLKQIAETGARASDVAAAMGVSVAVLDARLKAGTQDAAQFGDALSKALIDKGAKAVDVAANSLDGLKKRFSNSLDKLFEGVNTGPFLDELSRVVDLFDQSTASGAAMHEVIVTTLDAIFDAASTALPYVRTGFLLAALAVVSLLEMLDGLYENFKSALDIAEQATDAAENFVTGLVDGITNGIPLVIDAAKNAAQSVVGAVKDELGIQSPSVVMMDVGQNVSAGMAQGIANDNSVAGAARDLGRDTAEAGAAVGSAPAPEGGGGGTLTVNVGGIHINGAGKDAQNLTEEAVSLVFERIAAAQGYGSAA